MLLTHQKLCVTLRKAFLLTVYHDFLSLLKDVTSVQVVNFDAITTETDQWSLGVLCFILLSGKYLPHDGNDDSFCHITM